MWAAMDHGTSVGGHHADQTLSTANDPIAAAVPDPRKNSPSSGIGDAHPTASVPASAVMAQIDDGGVDGEGVGDGGGGRGGGGGGPSWPKQQWVRLTRLLLGVVAPTRRGGMRGHMVRRQSLAATDDQINQCWRDAHLQRARQARYEAECLESYPEHADCLSDWYTCTQISCQVNEELACLYEAKKTAAHGNGSSQPWRPSLRP